MLRKATLIFAAVVFMIFSATQASAQSFTNDVSISVSPENPNPNSEVTVYVKSFSLNLPSALFEWSVDGKDPVGGVGIDHYTVSTKAIGVPTNITLTITPVGGSTIIRKIVINPMSVDLLWEANNSVVPPFYKGKAMPTSESDVTFVAIPNIKDTSGSLVPSQTLVYNWKENYTSDSDNSGYGRNYFNVSMDYLNPTKNISVSVSSRDNKVTTGSEINLDPVSPMILFYASSPLYGTLFNRTLEENYSVIGNDTSIAAEPYFFSPTNPSSKVLKYEWTLNGDNLDNQSFPNMMSLHRSDTNAKGTANLGLTITNITKLFQEATSSLTLSLE